MKNTIKIKINGGRIKCRTNANTELVVKALNYVCKAPSKRAKAYRRTIAFSSIKGFLASIKIFFGRLSKGAKAFSTAFKSEDINRHQYPEVSE